MEISGSSASFPEDRPPWGGSFGKLLRWHYENATRSTVSPGEPSEHWTPQEFGEAIHLHSRNIYGLFNSQRPRNYGAIAAALFGDHLLHKQWEKIFRAAYEKLPKPPFATKDSNQAQARSGAGQQFTEDPTRSPGVGSGWTSLLAGLDLTFGKILLTNPHTRYPTFTKAGPPRTNVPLGRPFWCAISSPMAAEGCSLWAGWHAFFFSLNLETDGVMSLYERLLEEYEKGSMFYPDAGDLYFPWNDRAKGPEMLPSVDDLGKDFELICLLLSQDASQALADAARREVSANLGEMILIENDLRKAAVAISSYRVTEGGRGK